MRHLRSSVSARLAAVHFPVMLFVALGLGCSSPNVIPVDGYVVPATAVIVDLTYPLALPAVTAAGEGGPGGTEPGPRNRGNSFLAAQARTTTFIQAPAATVPGRITVDRIGPGRLVGPAVVVDITSRVEVDPDYRLGAGDLGAWEHRNGPLPSGAIVLMRTGWGLRWGKVDSRQGSPRDLYLNPDEAGQPHFAGFSPDAAHRLAATHEIQGIGGDTPCAGGSDEATAHKVLQAMHGAGLFVLGNLANLERLPENGAVLFVAPLRLEGATEAPVRVFALVPRHG